ncbi:hypothetical protein [Bacillus luti]|uniref:hypothetical protein n=1 Tax=Bacillus luti TaxID=2026191 RepID=UPI002898B4B5|nr:hypothetical protein [Bacillus luti]
MEDMTSLGIFGMLIACSAWLLYITYEPIKTWAWSDVGQNKKAHGNVTFKKKHLL